MQYFFKSAKRARKISVSASESAAHGSKNERLHERRSSFWKNNERVNALIMKYVKAVKLINYLSCLFFTFQ